MRNQDLDFTIPEISEDELGQVFATFAHDLRNLVMVLKGTVKQLRQGMADEGTLDRLETCMARVERYIEVMSSIQRLAQLSAELLKDGPRSFGRVREEAGHFGMGLYSSWLLCRRYGGDLQLENRPSGSAEAPFCGFQRRGGRLSVWAKRTVK